MKESLLLALTLVITLFISGPVTGAIIDRIIHAGDTPLASTCTISQTGPMELTIPACTFTTTGEALIVKKEQVQNLSQEIQAGRVEMMPDGKRVRGWLRDEAGRIIERSKNWVLPSDTVISIPVKPVDARYQLLLVEGNGNQMSVLLQEGRFPARPESGVVQRLVMPFWVPAGTQTLTDIPIEVVTVRPGFRENHNPNDALFKQRTIIRKQRSR